MRRIAAAIAAITLVAGAAQADAQGHGKGNQGGGKQAAGNQGGGGGGHGNGGNRGNAERGNQGGGQSMAQASRGPDNRGNGGGGGNAMRESRGNGGGQAMNDNRGGGNANRGGGGGNTHADRGNGGGNANADRGNGGGNRNANRGNGGNDRAVASDNRGRGSDNRVVVDNRGRGNDRGVVIERRGNGRDVDVVRVNGFSDIAPRGLIDGCPPGLAKKNPPCVPPGQVRARYWDRPDFWGLNRLDDGRYYYDDGYLVRYAPAGGILGYVPLLGGALAVGNAWPSYYRPVALPTYYESYYGLGPYNSYRYADNVIYRIDPETAAITSIAALLTGDQFTVGQPMPLGYDIYNVPYAYRTQYVDGPNALYRYSDGYVYQLDPETRLIAAAIELLAT